MSLITFGGFYYMTNDVCPKDQDKHFLRNNNFLIHGAKCTNKKNYKISTDNHYYDFIEVTGKEYPMGHITVPRLTYI